MVYGRLIDGIPGLKIQAGAGCSKNNVLIHLTYVSITTCDQIPYMPRMQVIHCLVTLPWTCHEHAAVSFSVSGQKCQGAYHRDRAAGEWLRAQVGVQVRSRPYGDVWEWNANSVCAESVSVALTAGEVVLQTAGSLEG